MKPNPTDSGYIRRALTLARRGYGMTSPNPLVGAVLVKRGEIIGRGWHHRAGEPHAEIEALEDAHKRGASPAGAALYVTLEPCCTHGRTPPCTDAIIGAGIKTVVAGATDPNPAHRGKGFTLLRRAGIAVKAGVLGDECKRLNEAFNHWIVQGTPFVVVKAAMTLDGKIATVAGESKWITGKEARTHGMRLRQGADAILVGINTVLADNPSLTVRTAESRVNAKKLRRIVLDSKARTPLDAKIVRDEFAFLTTIVVSERAPKARVAALARRVGVVVAPTVDHRSQFEFREAQSTRRRPSPPWLLDLTWLLKHLGSENITQLLVEGGGEVNASFLMQRLAHRIAFFYAPKILGGRDSLRAVAGEGARNLDEALSLTDLEWSRLGFDWLLTARLVSARRRSNSRRP